MAKNQTSDASEEAEREAFGEKILSIPQDIDAVVDADELFVVNPSLQMFQWLVTAAYDDQGTEVRMLAEESVLKAVASEFPIMSKVAELVDGGLLELRTTNELPRNELLLGGGRVIVVVTDSHRDFGIVTGSVEFTDALTEGYSERWEAASGYELRTPPLNHIRETLEMEFGDELRTDFDAVFELMEAGELDLDPAITFLLLAARRDELVYDLGHWAEDVGIASKATMSRKKSILEEVGLVTTENVPIDVGRPRQRLRLADEALDVDSPEELIVTATELVSE